LDGIQTLPNNKFCRAESSANKMAAESLARFGMKNELESYSVIAARHKFGNEANNSQNNYGVPNFWRGKVWMPSKHTLSTCK
jgi:hypothetical protein